MKKFKHVFIALLGCMIISQPSNAQFFKQFSNAFKDIKKSVTEGAKNISASKNSSKNSNNEATLVVSSDDTTLNNSASKSSDDEVTLVVSSDGTTKDEAVKTALRSAIEQAYGTFVSANTTILDDELVKDEIVTVSSGNIKSYSEISCNVTPNGKTYVTLQATVCISKLVSYAQSKGAEAEFAGATFGMNMRMKDLNKKNEEIAMKNLADQVIALYPSAFSYKLLVDEPKQASRGELDFGYGIYSNESIPQGDLLQVRRTFSLKEDAGHYGLTGNYEDYYASTFSIIAVPNNQMRTINNLIDRTLHSLELSDSELEEYKKLNIKWHCYWCNGHYFNLRSDCKQVLFDLNEAIAKILFSFEIIDNMGNSSMIKWKLWRNRMLCYLSPYSGTNLLYPWTKQGDIGYSYKSDHINLPCTQNILCRCIFFIPKNEIQNYSNFRIKAVPVSEINFVNE